jgi:hypothetical protein
MNKKELAELRKLYKPESSAIGLITGCYVDGEKNKKAVFKERLFALNEEDVFKYLEILKKGLGGSIGRNLVNVEFPRESESQGSMHELLMGLRDCQLEDAGLLETFYDTIIKNFEISGNYLILLSSAAYDVPGKTTDDIMMEDASDEVFRFIQCVICPVELSKPALSYDEENRGFSHRIRDWVVEMPVYGLLFPAFTDRSADIHAMLMYTKDVKDLRSEMMQSVFGCTTPLPAGEQKNSFASVLETTLGDELKLDDVREISESLIEMKEESEQDKDKSAVEIGAGDIRYLMRDTDIGDEKTDEVVEAFEEIAKDSPILLDNIVSRKTFEVKTESISVKVDASKSYLVSEKTIDGKRCIVIDTDGEQVEVNGVIVG